MYCNVCSSKDILELNKNAFLCKRCNHVFTNFEFEKVKEYSIEDETLSISRYSSNELFKDIKKESVKYVKAQNFLEFSPNPQALLYDLYRIMMLNSSGSILISKNPACINYFTFDTLKLIFHKAGFKIKNNPFFTRIKSIFSKNISIKFYK